MRHNLFFRARLEKPQSNVMEVNLRIVIGRYERQPEAVNKKTAKE